MSIVDRYEPYSTTREAIEADEASGAPLLPWTRGFLTEVTPVSDGSGWRCVVDSLGFFVPKLPHLEELAAAEEPDNFPAVDDYVELYNGGWGCVPQGIIIRGVIVFYRTFTQQEERKAQDYAAFEADRLEHFERERPVMEARFEKLSPTFKARIVRLRALNPDWRKDYMGENYESFILSQADLLADHFQTVEAVQEWAAMKDYAAQEALAPEGWDDGHSGNTHSCAIRFAIARLQGTEV